MKRQLERRLSEVVDFEAPSAALEQYRTPADLAAHLLTLADLHDDVADRVVLDLGAGTGMLAIGAAFLDPERVLAIELDASAVRIGIENEGLVHPPQTVEWILGDATRVPICERGLTVVSNPPFGAQAGNRNADRRFLETTAELARVSYTIHNEGSQDFVDSFVEDYGGHVTHAFAATFPLPRQFSFHTASERTLDAEVYRIAWSD